MRTYAYVSNLLASKITSPALRIKRVATSGNVCSRRQLASFEDPGDPRMVRTPNIIQYENEEKAVPYVVNREDFVTIICDMLINVTFFPCVGLMLVATAK